MRFLSSFLISLLIFAIQACGIQTESNIPIIASAENRIVNKDFQTLLDSALVKGSVLLFDKQEGKYYSNDFERAERGFIPASTFKIANSIVALETGVVESDQSVFRWDGESRALDSWEADLTLRNAYKVSCVPCYKEVAREVGVDRMNKTLDRISYTGMLVDSLTLDLFWLEGESEISQMQQIDFLRRLQDKELGISARTDSLMREIMIWDSEANWVMRAKTGWAVIGDQDIGWFVGFVEQQGRSVFFATNIEPGDGFQRDDFARIRIELTRLALAGMGWLDGANN